ncbi:MAG: hypothetical protein IPL23_23565 [Saprospiraceae bacterium]|nr:hypothetical protein [Saprospiraceae bacterium]
MDKQKDLNEPQILQKLKDTDKSQYSNLKRHLYKQIMISLRMIYIQKKADIEIREYLDFVDILYSKGLYIQSLKLLEKAKGLALKSNNDILSFLYLKLKRPLNLVTSPELDQTTLVISPIWRSKRVKKSSILPNFQI